MKRVNRLLKMIELLQSDRPCTSEYVCKELGISRRTFFRDLKMLQLAGVPCRLDRGDNHYKLDRVYLLPPVYLSLDEALAFMLLTRKALHEQIHPMHRSALTVAMKIEQALPPKVRDHCGEVAAGVEMRYWPLSDLRSVEDVLLAFQQAYVDRRKVAVTYDSYFEGREIETVLHPFRLIFVRRAWYVIAFCEREVKALTFKLERVIRWNVLEESYAIDETFDLDDYFGNAWHMIRGKGRHRVVIVFSKTVAGNVDEVFWHKTQRIRRLRDGRILFRADVDGLKEILWWILGYGKEAVVRKPLELRKMVREHAAAMTTSYDRINTSKSEKP